MTINRSTVNRRDFLIASSLAVASARTVTAAAKGATGQAARPNILLIMTDQQFAGAMGCAGNPFLNTPAMDSLAENGVLFQNAYCANPLCVPSRTVMMTGRMPHETGITTNKGAKADDFKVPLLGKYLADGGYDCGYAGKWHLPVKPSEKAVHGFGWFPEDGKQLRDADIPKAAAAFLARKREAPFLLVASFVNPHDICQWARGETLPHGSIPDPPVAEDCPPLPDNHGIPEREPEVIRQVQRSFPEIYPSVNWPSDKWRQYRWAYYRLVEKVDARIGELLQVLRSAGVEDNTLIVFTADHGDGVAAHHWNQKQVLYEEATRVPFILSNKHVVQAGRKDTAHLVSAGLDLIPTLCDYAGIPHPEGLGGLSVRSLAEGKEPAQFRDYLVCETEFARNDIETGIRGRMLRTQRYKYIIYSEGTLREQLFDMETDRGEMRNMVDVPEQQSVLEACRTQLLKWGRETGDDFPYVQSS